ncbi:hypothetical protein D6833_05110 [Candidatus Parcubacteria bacterium]|nr:MAG: hypothetical protein D6833_05110 [Candidatus Parcubacteria bacterium]
MMRGLFYVLLAIDGALAIALGVVLGFAWKVRPRMPYGRKPRVAGLTLEEAIFREEWKKIAAEANRGTLEALRQAVEKADNLVDTVLRHIGLPGAHMLDRLNELSGGELRTLEGIWHAHHFRTKLSEDPNLHPSLEELKEALRSYEAFLHEIGAI